MKIFLISTLILYLEMLLIRIISTEIRIFAYLQNVILITCFMGLSLGSIHASSYKSLRRFYLSFFALCIILTVPPIKGQFSLISDYLSLIFEGNMWFSGIVDDLAAKLSFTMYGLFLSFIIIFLVWNLFLPLGALLGLYFNEDQRNVWQYSLNILGSILGTILFSILSFFSLPPSVWCSIALFLIFMLFFSHLKEWKMYALFVIIFSISLYAYENVGANKIFWSPYQKLELVDHPHTPNSKMLLVNNVGYQLLLDLSSSNIKLNKDIFNQEYDGYSHYDLPFKFSNSLERVLILGSGVGTDVAAGIRHNAKIIDAVDIDPVIIDIGKKFHPEKPYADARVTVINDDARAVLKNKKEKYDLIVFGLLDAHTSGSLSNVRLDHYIYTQEAINDAKSLLSEKGVMILSFGMAADHIISRIHGILSNSFTDEPIVFNSNVSKEYGWGGVMFLAGNKSAIREALHNDVRLADFVSKRTISIKDKAILISTDDWPYLYLETNRIPFLYHIFTLLIVALFFMYNKSVSKTIRIFNSSRMLKYFFMGAAFMLLEIQSINLASVLLSNTWIVALAIILSILMMALLSSVVSMFLNQKYYNISYLFLFICISYLYAYDLTFVRNYASVNRFFVVSFILSIPMFYSGLIFMKFFRSEKVKNDVLGANLFGSLFGAVLQNITFIIGIRHMYLVVFLLYFVVLACDVIETRKDKSILAIN